MVTGKKGEEVKIAPVLLVGFRRPEATSRVFNEIRKAKPSKYFLYVDAPRNEEEKVKVDMVKKIASEVDWPCEFKTFFRTKNEGIIGLPEALEWFITQVGEGITLEDDAVPNQDFFRFCSELLKKYRDDERVICINGINIQRGWSRDDNSYYFSKYPTPKAFAIWKRSWDKYDNSMKSYPDFVKKDYISDIIKNRLEKFLIKKILHDAYYKIPEAADSRWVYSIFTNNGLAITPNKNLVTDTGFGEGAGHTKKIDSYLSMPSEKISFPIKHPKMIIRDDLSDARHFRWLFKRKIIKHFFLKTGLYKFLK